LVGRASDSSENRQHPALSRRAGDRPGRVL